MKPKTTFTAFLLAFSMLALNGISINPILSNYLINLSEGAEGTGHNDKVPEMVISGNTIHVVWLQNPPFYAGESILMYRRSTDLGGAWEEINELMVFKDGNYGTEEMSRRLAIYGDNVYIFTADYHYSENGTGKLHYFQSQNGGSTFKDERIIATTSGRAVAGKVVVAYSAAGDKYGSNTYVADLYFDGNQLIVLHPHYTTSYGYVSTSKVWISTSRNGAAFTTRKISAKYIKDNTERERCYVVHNSHFSSKIVRSGNHIHVVFTGYTEREVWTTFYSRSTNGGNSFETGKDIGSLFPENIQNGSETVAFAFTYDANVGLKHISQTNHQH